MNGVNGYLDLRNVNGTTVYGVRGTDWALVKRNEKTGDFEPVDKIDTSISAQSLDANYGVWVDKEVTSGMLWWKKVERPKDGKIQADEVVDFTKFRDSQTSHVWHRLVGQDDLYTFESAQVQVNSTPDGQKEVRLPTEWNLYHGDWSRYWEPMSPLAPPNAQ